MCNSNILETPFFCKRDDLRIRGMQYLPDGNHEDHKYPAIIVSHGFTGNYLSTADYCRSFAQMGYAAYSFNFCGAGRNYEEDGLKSEGDSTETTIRTEVEDLIAVKDYVKALEHVDETNIVLAGVSQGGMVSGLTAARLQDEISKLIMIYPALCIPDHARRGRLGGASYDVNNVPEIIDCGKTQLGKEFHDSVVSMDVFLELSAYTGPVLILQGLEDRTVNYSYSIRAKESYAPGQCHLQLIRDVGHSVDEKQKASLVASMRQFLLERQELLTVQVIITERECVTENERKTSRIYFTGYCDNEYFHGTILPGGCDTQEHYQDELVNVRAEYTLEGIDMAGEKCQLQIVNQSIDGEWKPTVKTDSEVLAWLNDADLTAVLEGSKVGPTVRIFGKQR